MTHRNLDFEIALTREQWEQLGESADDGRPFTEVDPPDAPELVYRNGQPVGRHERDGAMHDSGRRSERTGWLRVIAALKLLKAVLLIAVGLGAFHLLQPGAAQAAERWLGRVAATYATGGLPARAVRAALDKVRFLSGRRAAVLGTAALLYAGLFAAEGVGLWLGKRWAEWLTVVATGLLVPVELYEVIHGATAPRILALVANVAMVAYLVVRIRRTS